MIRIIVDKPKRILCVGGSSLWLQSTFFDFDGLSRNQNTTTKIGGRQNLKDEGQTRDIQLFRFRANMRLSSCLTPLEFHSFRLRTVFGIRRFCCHALGFKWDSNRHVVLNKIHRCRCKIVERTWIPHCH